MKEEFLGIVNAFTLNRHFFGVPTSGYFLLQSLLDLSTL